MHDKPALPRLPGPATRPWRWNARVSLGALLLGLASPVVQADPRWPAPVREAMEQAQISPQSLSAVVWPLHPLSRRWEHQPDRPMPPASIIKVLTTAVALHRLDPELRSRTDLLTDAPQDGEVLRGDVYWRGGADPQLGLGEITQMLLELRERGIREIAGDMVLDRSLFQPTRTDRGLAPFDDRSEFPYNVVPDALQFAGNLLGLDLSADDQRLSVRSLPTLSGVSFITDKMRLSSTPCAQWRQDWRTPVVTHHAQGVEVVLQGSFPRQCQVRAWLNLIERDRLAGLTFQALWTRLGGTWSGQVREGTTPAQARLLATHEGPLWRELIRPINKRSDNTYTRLLYLTLGTQAGLGSSAGPAATTAARAQQVVRDWLTEQRIGHDSLVLDNGSGLSRSERLSARLLAQVLKTTLEGPHAADLLMSLPIAGVDGAMKLRLQSSAAAQWARLKTGALNDVVSVAGVVYDAQRRPHVVVAMVHHPEARRARPALDALIDWVARGR